MGSVLVIDDCAEFRELMVHALALEGLDAIAFSSALTAFDFITTNASLPYTVFVDTHMPDVSGPDFILKIRGLKGSFSLRIILMSASPEVKNVARQVGADGFLTKPFELTALFNLVGSQKVPEVERP